MELLKQNFTNYLRESAEWSTFIAITSFVIGTLFFSAHQLGGESNDLILFGFMYVCAATVVNFVVLANLVISFCIEEKRYQQYVAIKILIVLANIPIVLAYLQFL